MTRCSLSVRRQEKRGESFFSLVGSLDGSKTRRTRSDGISWSFVHKNSSLRFVNIFCTFFFIIHFITHFTQLCVTMIFDISVSRNSTASRKSYIPADCLSPIVEFCEQSNLNSLTRTQVHGYILQVVNFYRFYYWSFLY